ncbi:putative quinol monooxygenase [Microbacterium sp. 179-B 1A2 NHS]|uniref:putative quinol monooxygenase n=1 Tax=Microbacterium sp. 179-B 1A2 NHS TaxID=3142383 RepID=UPI0039A28FDD
MSEIHLTGHLVCRTSDEVATVAAHLPEHTRRTRAEAGCLHFEVGSTADPLVWSVQERFADEESFRAHQERVADSEWGRRTAGIERRYSVAGLTR